MHFCRAGREKPVADFDWSLWKHGSEKVHKTSEYGRSHESVRLTGCTRLTDRMQEGD